MCFYCKILDLLIKGKYVNIIKNFKKKEEKK